MASKEKKYQAMVDGLIRKAEAGLDTEAKKVIRLLSDTRKKVAAAVGTTEWQTYYLPQQQAAIERALEEFARQFGKDLSEAQRNFWQSGIDMVDKPLSVMGVGVAIPAIDVTVLHLMQDYGAKLVGGLGRDAAQKIVNELMLGLMGQKTPFDVMTEVGKNLKDPSIFKSIAARAETITQQECGRILEAASQARMEKASEVVPGLQKQWKHGNSRMPRLTHLAANGQIRNVNEPFDVGGEALMYPRDPAGSAGNTIKCSCFMVPYHADWNEALAAAA